MPASRTQTSVQRRAQASAAAQTMVSAQTKAPEPRKVNDLGEAGHEAAVEGFGDFDRGFVAGGRAGVAFDHDDVGDQDEEGDGEDRHQAGEFEAEGAAGGEPVADQAQACSRGGGRRR